MSASHIILDNLPSLCQKLSDLVEVGVIITKIILLVFLRHSVEYIKQHYLHCTLMSVFDCLMRCVVLQDVII